MVNRSDHQPDGPCDPAIIPSWDRRSRQSNRGLNDYEAYELQQLQTQEDDGLDDSGASLSSGEYRVTARRTVSRVSRASSHQQRKGLWGAFCEFWTNHVTLTVPERNNRDHFALERTFLAYVRTSMMIAMQGVFVAQLFRLQRSTADHPTGLSFFKIGVPLSTSYHGVALLVTLMGAYRFWKQQHAIATGKIHGGGWDLIFVGFLVGLLIVTTLILTIVAIINIGKS